jgi:1,2-diacylglycerol 3-beta-galactosyltransferase
MAEYMVAADILISKAGPGTIAEAAALSLPVMLTSFLPGQEEGNVNFVVDHGFGSYISDDDPSGIAEEVSTWLLNEEKMSSLSKCAKAVGAPHAARDIVSCIGDITVKWKKINNDRDQLDREEDALRRGI